MSSLSRTKMVWKKIYSKNAAYINPLVKFLMALLIFIVINASIGYMDKINNFGIVLIVSLFCSFMPLTVMAALAGLFILLHMYALSIECALVAAVALFLMFILFIRFTPKEAIVVILTPVTFMMGIPYVMPVAMGLLGGPASIISVSCGVVISYLVSFVAGNDEAFMAMGDETLIARLRFVIDGMVANKAMIVMIIMFGIILMTVYVIRRLSIDYSWRYASIVGAVVSFILFGICEMVTGMGYSMLGIVFGSALAIPVGMMLDLLALDLDYSGSENLQFEDDDYYYYVKAVPKAEADIRKKKTQARRTQDNVSERYPSAGHSQGSRTVRTANGVKRSTEY